VLEGGRKTEPGLGLVSAVVSLCRFFLWVGRKKSGKRILTLNFGREGSLHAKLMLSHSPRGNVTNQSLQSPLKSRNFGGILPHFDTNF
jgi:hypothetical protein